MTAAYADPGLVPALMMIPALAQGTAMCGGRPRRAFASSVSSEATRAVMLPLPSSDWRTK